MKTSIYALSLILLSSCATSQLISVKGYHKEIDLLNSTDTCYAVNVDIRKTGREITYIYNTNPDGELHLSGVWVFRQVNMTIDQVAIGRELHSGQLTAIHAHSLMGYDSDWIVQITPMLTNTDKSNVMIIATNKNICN